MKHEERVVKQEGDKRERENKDHIEIKILF